MPPDCATHERHFLSMACYQDSVNVVIAVHRLTHPPRAPEGYALDIQSASSSLGCSDFWLSNCQPLEELLELELAAELLAPSPSACMRLMALNDPSRLESSERSSKTLSSQSYCKLFSKLVLRPVT